MSTERRASVLLRREESGGQVGVVASTARAGELVFAPGGVRGDFGRMIAERGTAS